MSLMEFDIVGMKLDRTTTWVNPKYKRIFTNETVRQRLGYYVAKKISNLTGQMEYYIIATDDTVLNQKTNTWSIDDYGRVKFNIDTIWKDLGLSKLDRQVNIDFKCVESTDSYDVYLINV